MLKVAVARPQGQSCARAFRSLNNAGDLKRKPFAGTGAIGISRWKIEEKKRFRATAEGWFAGR